MVRNMKVLLLCLFVLIVSGCATQAQKKDYTSLRTESPRSILVVPVINRSVEVNAPDYFLSTISQPLAERGYYVFPVHLVKRMMEDDGLGDADMVHAGNPQQLGKIFGADSVMYVTIERWDAQYIVFSTTVTVELKYTLKSTSTGQTLWSNSQKLVYQPNNNNSGGGLAGLIAQAVTAAIAKAAPNYMPLAHQANVQAIYTKGQGLPAGPYSDLYQKDQTDF
ncbi:MAG TPA: GNA1162 family protein [Herminiimonas sp.]|nr:GNA1162 family protein [Herminiimonas sp.]